MRILQTLVYLISGIYSIGLLIDFICYLWKYRCITDISEVKALNKYSTLLLLLCLVITPLNLYQTIITSIPEGDYTINAILELRGDNTDYSVPIEVYCYTDVEYEEDVNHDYYFDGGFSTKTTHNKVFLLLDVTPPTQVNIPNFTPEYLDWLPDTIRSNETYDVDFLGLLVSGYDEWGDPIIEDGGVSGQLRIPPLTKENLGITLEDQIQSFSVLGYIERILLITSAIVCLLLLKADNYWKKQK